MSLPQAHDPMQQLAKDLREQRELCEGLVRRQADFEKFVTDKLQHIAVKLDELIVFTPLSPSFPDPLQTSAPARTRQSASTPTHADTPARTRQSTSTLTLADTPSARIRQSASTPTRAATPNRSPTQPLLDSPTIALRPSNVQNRETTSKKERESKTRGRPLTAVGDFNDAVEIAIRLKSCSRKNYAKNLSIYSCSALMKGAALTFREHVAKKSSTRDASN